MKILNALERPAGAAATRAGRREGLSHPAAAARRRSRRTSRHQLWRELGFGEDVLRRAVARARPGGARAGRDRARGAGERQDARRRCACRSEADKQAIEAHRARERRRAEVRRRPDGRRRWSSCPGGWSMSWSDGASLRRCCSRCSLAGCGFQLRGTADAAVRDALRRRGAAGGIALELKRSIAGRHAHAAWSTTRRRPRRSCRSPSEMREKEILSLTGTGRVREFQLRYRVRLPRARRQGRATSCRRARSC